MCMYNFVLLYTYLGQTAVKRKETYHVIVIVTNYQSNNLLRASLTWLDLPSSLLFYFSRAKLPPSRTWARNSATLSSSFHSPPGRLWCHNPSTSTANIQKLSHRTTADFSSLHTTRLYLDSGEEKSLHSIKNFPPISAVGCLLLETLNYTLLS